MQEMQPEDLNKEKQEASTPAETGLNESLGHTANEPLGEREYIFDSPHSPYGPSSAILSKEGEVVSFKVGAENIEATPDMKGIFAANREIWEVSVNQKGTIAGGMADESIGGTAFSAASTKMEIEAAAKDEHGWMQRTNESVATTPAWKKAIASAVVGFGIYGASTKTEAAGRDKDPGVYDQVKEQTKKVFGKEVVRGTKKATQEGVREVFKIYKETKKQEKKEEKAEQKEELKNIKIDAKAEQIKIETQIQKKELDKAYLDKEVKQIQTDIRSNKEGATEEQSTRLKEINEEKLAIDKELLDLEEQKQNIKLEAERAKAEIDAERQSGSGGIFSGIFGGK